MNMKILAHRGMWDSRGQQNSLLSFKKAFSLNIGIETDIRDSNGELVISHDIPQSDNNVTVRELFELYSSFGNQNITLALNIKADGLQQKLKFLLDQYNIENYFVFDMSVPDALGYIKNDINVFTRMSEYEAEPAFYESACGVWMDEFRHHWITTESIRQHLANNRSVCIVSPELHGRDHRKEWAHYKDTDKQLEGLLLCTDFVAEARSVFNG
jgi:hypothetical protein